MISVPIITVIIFIILVIGILTMFAFNSNKSLGHILAEIKYEIIYNILGARALLDDFILRTDPNLESSVESGTVALITGGTRGIGLETIKSLLVCNYQIIIGCRNVEAGNNAVKDIRSEGIKQGDVYVYPLDLSSIQAVKLFAAEVKRNHPKIHLLINNAGKMFGPFLETEDGYESQFATNYLGHFFLTHLLLPEITAAGSTGCKSRIINVSSCAHIAGEIDFNDIHNRNQYIASKAYAQSKLAQILFTNYLNLSLQEEDKPVAVYSVHPGVVNTDLFIDTNLKKFMPWIPRLFFKTPKQGAATVVFTCISPQLENSGGTYISNCQIMPTSGIAYSTVLQGKLFEFTLNLLGIQVFGQP